MSDEFSTKPEDETEAELADAAEEMAAVDEVGETFDEEERAAKVREVLALVEDREMRDRVWWTRVHNEHLTFLFANCLLFAGSLAAWSRFPVGEGGDASTLIHGLDTIRGAAIFGLALYGFFTAVFNIWYRGLKLWPFLLGGVIGLWAGIEGILATMDSGAIDAAKEYADAEGGSFLSVFLTPLSAIAPGYWLITAGGLLVVFVLLKGILGGRAKAKASAREARSGGRRRR